MRLSAKHDGFKDFILDQLTELNGVTVGAMFGGYGLYQNAKFFGIIHKGRLYFKVSTAIVPNYKERGMKPFRPNAKQTLKSFYEVPIDVIEDAEVLTQWATTAVTG
ncbi:MAG: TfoX/Sxy family protein [Nitrospira sp.]|nr:TfoX/Sxy family protein [Nitrospira sp.]